MNKRKSMRSRPATRCFQPTPRPRQRSSPNLCSAPRGAPCGSHSTGGHVERAKAAFLFDPARELSKWANMGIVVAVKGRIAYALPPPRQVSQDPRGRKFIHERGKIPQLRRVLSFLSQLTRPSDIAPPASHRDAPP